MKNCLPAWVKTCVFILCCCLFVSNASAQYVTIPDANFVSWLQNNGFAGCMNGNQLDITCPAVTSATSISCNSQNIQDLTGIENFTSLVDLDCSSNAIMYIPPLPSNLNTFNCDNNALTYLPSVPDGLFSLQCAGNAITSLPSLPSELTYLDCSDNPILTLPSPLPSFLSYLACEQNPIAVLPALPASLTTLICDFDSLNALPALPSSLGNLVCSNNKLTALPALPASLTRIVCGGNPLTSMPALPGLLQYLDCGSITSTLVTLPALPASLKYLICDISTLNLLPALPAGLLTLDCSFSLLTSLPALPASLTQLKTDACLLTALPALPVSLTQLICSQNPLTALPLLPPHLTVLQCNKTQIATLPPLPAGLTELDCTNDSLTSLPTLPDSLYTLAIGNNPTLTCLPRLNKIHFLNFNGTGITCLPNYGEVYSSTPALNTLPLCGIYNATGCQPYWNISGQVYYDANGNCTFDSADVGQGYVKMNLTGGGFQQQVYSSEDGEFSFLAQRNVNYTLRPDTTDLPFKVRCPNTGQLTTVLTAIDSLSFDNNFALQCRTNGVDVGVKCLLSNKLVRPGDNYVLLAAAGDISQFYGSRCAAGVSGTVQLIFTGQVTCQGAAAGALTPSNINGNTLTWNIADFGAINSATAFNMLFKINNNATAGSEVCYTMHVTTTATDFNPGNNTAYYCFTVLDALDPNEKEVYPANIDSAGQWLTYTIRFQNVGTAAAVNVRVADTLDVNLDPSSFELLAYSAKNLTQISGNAVVFNFPNINLADSATSDSLSRGYVQYRIKTAAPFNPLEKIYNTASIYFDLNPAVVTNTVVDSVQGPVPVCAVTYNTLSRAICTGDTFYVGATAYTHAGNYTDTLTGANTGGCDSVVYLTLTVNALPVVSTSGTCILQNGGIDDCYFFSTIIGTAINADSVKWELNGLPVHSTNDTLTLTVDSGYPYPGTVIAVPQYDVQIACFTAYNNCGSATTCDSLRIVTEGINEILSNNPLTIYPNPTTGQLIIKTQNFTAKTIDVFDVDGRLVSAMPFKNETDITALSSGIYFVEVKGEEGVVRKRVVKF